jgi:uncharacterized protein DUF2800
MSDYTEHARLSPSGSKRWMACAGSIVMEEQVPARSNQAADNGTCCHIIAARCLTEHWPATKYIGEEVKVSATGEEDRFVEFDEDLCDLVLLYVKWARQYTIGPKVSYWVEQRVEFSRYVDVPDQFGTADLLVIDTVMVDGVEVVELQVHDAKFGHRPVLVERNSQLMLYALGAIDMLELSYDIQRVRIVIHQPQVNKGPIEFSLSVAELLEFAKIAGDKAQKVELATQRFKIIMNDEGLLTPWYDEFLNPSPNEDECAYCRAMAHCPAAARAVEQTVGASFSHIIETKDPPTGYVALPGPHLDQQMKATGFLEDFIIAVRSRMEGHLLGGGASTLYGLELGRQGHRKWIDPEAVEKLLRQTYRLTIQQAFNTKLKSPTQIEKMAGFAGKTSPSNQATGTTGAARHPGRKGRPPALTAKGEKPVVGVQQWEELKKHITRKPPSPSVKPLALIKEPYKAPGLTGDSFSVVEDDIS